MILKHTTHKQIKKIPEVVRHIIFEQEDASCFARNILNSSILVLVRDQRMIDGCEVSEFIGLPLKFSY